MLFVEGQKHINGTQQRSPKYSKLIFDEGAKQFNGEKIAFSINGAGTAKYPKYKPQPKFHTL